MALITSDCVSFLQGLRRTMAAGLLRARPARPAGPRFAPHAPPSSARCPAKMPLPGRANKYTAKCRASYRRARFWVRAADELVLAKRAVEAALLLGQTVPCPVCKVQIQKDHQVPAPNNSMDCRPTRWP